ncbi:hypothetical protein [Salsipaludibacter albus]|uniref:hypothetical protein n=1 Tax=Salsipaludibacter albus TaxID=2849650 RepID=UPI001EE3A604|nr:hypothetical protein [Salsipaludibacter albus]MBY5163439.1 hypothetical protein [Salsipaludibacter albus]
MTTTLSPTRPGQAGARSDLAAPGTMTVLARAVAADAVRLRSLRSTWWSLAAGAAMMLALALAVGLDGEEVAPAWLAGEIGIVFAQFALLVPAMLLVTSDHATGTVQSTLLSVPRRGVLAVARLLVAVSSTVVAAVVLAAIADATAWVAMGQPADTTIGEVVASLGDVAIVMGVGTVLVVGTATVLRNAAGTLTAAFLGLLVLPAMLPEFGVPWLATIGESLPGAGTMSMLQAFGDPLLSTSRAVVVIVTWVVVAVVAATWSLVRRDA